MKKAYIIAMFILIIFCFTGCSFLNEIEVQSESEDDLLINHDAQNINESTTTQENNITTEQILDMKHVKFDVGTTITQGDIEITITYISIVNDESSKTTMFEAPKNYIEIGIEIENLSEDEKYTVYPNQGEIIVNTGETIECDIFYSDDLGGDIYELVRKEGKLIFPLKYTRINEICSLQYYINAPTDQNWNICGNRYLFDLKVDMVDYKEISNKEMIERIYKSLVDEINDSDEITKVYKTEIIEETGPIKIHIPVIAVSDNYEYLNNSPQDYIIIPVFIECISSEELTFYATQGILLTDSKEQLDAEMFMGKNISGEYYGNQFKVGTAFYKLKNTEALDIKEIKIVLKSPLDLEYEKLGESLSVVIALE